MPTEDGNPKIPDAPQNPEHPGYETTDVNVNGLLVFLAGLAGSLLVFFLICYLMGKVINGQIQKAEGPRDKWHQLAGSGKAQGMASSPELQQRELQQISQAFPEPRLDLDDGLQATADLHAREDLFLNYYSSLTGHESIHIPIERAMELIAERGLPMHVSPKTPAEPVMFGDETPEVEAPLTNGFARTGYEQSAIETREQKMAFETSKR
ncbi:MAG: hypothetical protein FWD64_03255 [Acidobacteriaceae bacterium]|nr:hypothetical protein [Acidobacteriaceae bacterium]